MWIKRLREIDGKITPCQGAMYEGSKKDFFAVLEDLYRETHPSHNLKRSWLFPNLKIKKWAGLPEESTLFIVPNTEENLVNYWDKHGLTFSQVADLIEKNL